MARLAAAAAALHCQVRWVHVWCGHPSHTCIYIYIGIYIYIYIYRCIYIYIEMYRYIIYNRQINPNETWIDDDPVMWAHSNPENDAEMVTLTPNFWHITPKTRTPYTNPQTHERQTPDPLSGFDFLLPPGGPGPTRDIW